MHYVNKSVFLFPQATVFKCLKKFKYFSSTVLLKTGGQKCKKKKNEIKHTIKTEKEQQ